MQIIFEDENLQELISTGRNRKYQKYSRDRYFMQRLIKAFSIMVAAGSTRELGCHSFLHYEQLRHLSLSSIRIANSYPERIIFRETDSGIVITILEMNTTHYKNKK